MVFWMALALLTWSESSDALKVGEWPLFRGEPSLRGVAPGTVPAQLELLWTYESGGAITSSPVVSEGKVYFGSDDMAVHAVDAQTGKGLWKFETDDIIEAPALVRDGMLFIGSSDFFFYSLDAGTGELRWKHETEDKILGGANWVTLSDGSPRLVVGSYDSKLYCFDPKTGEKHWEYATRNYINGTPAVSGEEVVFGGCDAILHVVSVRDGTSKRQVELGEACHVAGSVAWIDDEVYFGHYGNEFLCFDMKANQRKWSHVHPRHPFFSSPSIGQDRVVFGGRDKKLHCVDRKTGETLWEVPTKRKVDGSPVICGDKVVFGSADGRLFVVTLADGKQEWTYDLGKGIYASPAVAAGRVYVGGSDGLLYCFGDAAKQEGT